MFDRGVFFDKCRTGVMGPTLDGDEVAGSEAILDTLAGYPVSWCAYALATAWHETAHTMRPISEYGGKAYFTRMYDITGQRSQLAKSYGNTAPGDGYKYRGRGYVQLTWKVNYERAERELGEPLVANPDIAMRPGVAARIMLQGMREGWFTGKSFVTCLPQRGPARLVQFEDARRIINGTDKKAVIADYATKFQAALIAAGWTT